MNPNPILILIGFFVVGVAWWAFGQWLRNRGYGAKLDRLGAIFAKAQGQMMSIAKSVLSKGHHPKK